MPGREAARRRLVCAQRDFADGEVAPQPFFDSLLVILQEFFDLTDYTAAPASCTPSADIFPVGSTVAAAPSCVEARRRVECIYGGARAFAERVSDLGAHGVCCCRTGVMRTYGLDWKSSNDKS